MDDNLCKAQHHRVDEILSNHNECLKDHDGRIDMLEQYRSRSEVQVANLCEQIKSRVTTIKWSMGLLLTTAIGFVIWYIQSL